MPSSPVDIMISNLFWYDGRRDRAGYKRGDSCARYDPYEFRLSDGGLDQVVLNVVKHVYPAKVETVSFKLSTNTVKAGEPIIAYVTLKNTGQYTQRYKIAINLGPPKAGWELKEDGLLASKIVKVPPGEKTFQIPITMDKPGSYILVVDNWRIGQFDPGEPLVASLTVTTPTPYELEKEIKSISSTVSDIQTRVHTLETEMSRISESVTTLSSSVEALSAQTATITNAVMGVGILTIILVIIAIALIQRKK